MKQRNRSVVEYEKQFVQLNKYAREIVPTKEDMCVHFEDGLRDEIKILVGALEIREFVVLSNISQKIEEIVKVKDRMKKRSENLVKARDPKVSPILHRRK